MELNDLIELAKGARKNAYCPYSNYSVGSALKTKSGKVYTGCNIENNGIMSICSERVAFVKALSEGEKDFDCIVIVGGNLESTSNNCTPCGYCRQFMSEFVDTTFKIHMVSNDNITTYSINDLLPYNFNLNK